MSRKVRVVMLSSLVVLALLGFASGECVTSASQVCWGIGEKFVVRGECVGWGM